MLGMVSPLKRNRERREGAPLEQVKSQQAVKLGGGCPLDKELERHLYNGWRQWEGIHQGPVIHFFISIPYVDYAQHPYRLHTQM